MTAHAPEAQAKRAANRKRNAAAQRAWRQADLGSIEKHIGRRFNLDFQGLLFEL